MDIDILENIHKEEVPLALKHICGDKSLGPNQMYPKALWNAREETAGVLAEAHAPP